MEKGLGEIDDIPRVETDTLRISQKSIEIITAGGSGLAINRRSSEQSTV